MRASLLIPAVAAAVLVVGVSLAPAAPEEVTAKFLETEIALTRNGKFVVSRAAFEVTGPAHRWYSVQFKFLKSKGVPLLSAKGKPFQRTWNNLFTPDNMPTARWTDCRLAVRLSDLELEVANLNKGKQNVIWVTPALYDYENGEYVGNGWNARSPLVLDVDKEGRIIKASTFNVRSPKPENNHPSERIRAHQAKLQLKHLKPKPGTSVHVAYGLKKTPYIILINDKQQALLQSSSRIAFFQTPQNEQQARELALLPFSGAMIIKTPQQYNAILAAVKDLGWKVDRDILETQPESYGVTVTKIPELGYRVDMLMADRLDKMVRDVYIRRVHIGLDGRMSMDVKQCIRAPELGISAKEDFVQPLPAGPWKYSDAITKVLDEKEIQSVPEFVTKTGKTIAVPCRAGDVKRSYSDPE